MKILAALLLAAAAGTGLKAIHYGAPPPDFVVPAQHGSELLSQLRGRPVVINFWASWCPPCTDELPDFERLQQTYGDRVAVVTIDWDEDAGIAAQYLSAHHLDLPLVLDPQGRLYSAYSLFEVPDTIVLDAQGDVRYVSVGELSWKELSQAVDAVLPPDAPATQTGASR